MSFNLCLHFCTQENLVENIIYMGRLPLTITVAASIRGLSNAFISFIAAFVRNSYDLVTAYVCYTKGLRFV
jgi:hypothetical protein